MSTKKQKKSLNKKKFEYKPFNIQGMTNQKLVSNSSLDTFKAYELVLGEIGAEGWELIMIGSDVVGKREIS